MLKFFRVPFATSGTKTAIPDAVDASGYVSYTEGYGPNYQLVKTDPNSKNIERDKMNELFYDITSEIQILQAQGAPDFITSALNGGTAYSYSINAVVRYNNELYISLANSNTATPTDTTKWALLPTAGRVQACTYNAAVAGGTADALTGTFTPAITALPAAPGTINVMIRAGSANATTTPTFSPNGLTAKTIVKGSNTALVAGDIAGAGHWLELQYDATLDKWVLQNPATGVTASAVTQIQSVSSSVGANALTLGYGGGRLDFRNATLTNGAPNSNITVSALSITVPSGATLGTVNAIAARLVILVAYNGGSPVLCVANLSGGLQLDETNLISPTTISGTSNSASTIYSASAVGANSPYRVVGVFDITETTAGTWASDATLKQGVGGQALATLSSMGYGQTLQTGLSRVSGTNYYNTTGKPITVLASVIWTNTNGYSFSVNGNSTSIPASNISQTSSALVSFPVPPGQSYSITAASGINTWSELR